MWRRTLDSWGYSPLDQINRDNVAQNARRSGRAAWDRARTEATPLVYSGMMYIPNPGDFIQAMDARTGD